MFVEYSQGWLWSLPMTSGGLCLVAGLQLWQLRKELRIKLLMLTLGLLCLWGVANSLLIISPDVEFKMAMYIVHGDSSIVLALVVYYLARLLANPGYRPPARGVAVLLVALSVLMVFSFTEQARLHLFELGESPGGYMIPGVVPTLLCWLVYFALPFSIFVYNIGLFVVALPRLSPANRRLAIMYIAGITTLGLVAALYYFLGITPIAGLDPTPSMVGAMGIMMAFATFYFREDWAPLFSLGQDLANLDAKFFTYRLTVILVIPAAMVFSTSSFLAGKTTLGWAMLLMLVAIVAGFALMQESLGSQRKERIYAYFFSLILLLFGSVLVYTIGFRGELDKMPWAFLLPVVAIYGLGPGAGLTMNLAFLAALALISQVAGQGMAQDTELWVRFFLAQTCLTTILCFMDLARHRYLALLLKTERELRRHRDRLEDLVGRRTRELSQTVEQLRQEVAQREQSEVQLKEAKEAAEAASQAKTQFLANMSHELRTPLTHIMGFADVLLEGYSGELNDQQREYLGHVLASSRHLHSLINDLLDMSKIEADRLELSWSQVEIRPWIEDLVMTHGNRAAQAGTEIRAVFGEHPALAWMDQRKMTQVLMNLLANAIKFTPGGMISLEVSGRPGPAAQGGGWRSLELAVADNGLGIKPQDMERIFLPFEQADSSTSRRHDGSGLGLALSRRLVELHGGVIQAQSLGEGQGSRFLISLPWRESPPPGARQVEQS